METNERGLRLLEFATFNNLVLTNTLGPHKPSRRWTWHSPDGKHHNQIDYILVKKRFRSGVNIHRTRSFPGADIGSDHDLVMMTFLRLLEFATFNNLILTNTLGPHKPSRRWTWHSPDGKQHNQINYILVKKRFRSGVNIHRTMSFSGADIGSDHGLVMMTFLRLLEFATFNN